MAGKSQKNEHPIKTFGWAATDTSGVLSPFKFSRRATGDEDVRLKVLYCGICHTDLHNAKNDWGVSFYPFVSGHEIVGEVTEVGSKVTKFKIGEKIGVGTMIDSCGICNQCSNDLETYRPNLLTYLSKYYDGTATHRGYSNEMVVNEHFVVRWPENLPLDVGAPLLCAGSTVYSPMKFYGLNRVKSKFGPFYL